MWEVPDVVTGGRLDAWHMKGLIVYEDGELERARVQEEALTSDHRGAP